VVNPGFASMGGADGNERQQDWYDSPSFNGNRGQANNYILDGVDMNETLNNMSGYNPAPDSIAEMRVITGDADAEFGNVNGGEVLVVTKSGTNHFHGSLYNNFQNNVISATAWNGASTYGLPKYPFTQNQFGATIGGPIKKDKLFLFGDYLGFRYHRGGYGLATVAPTAFLNGDFSALLTPQYGDIQLYNPNGGNAGYSTATAYNNDEVPVVNPVAKFLAAHPSLYPAPNTPAFAGAGDLNNYQGPEKGYTVNNQGDVKVDYTIGPRDSVMGRYSIGDAYDFSSTVLPVQFPTQNDFPFQSLVLNYIHTFTPVLVNEFRAGVSRTVFNQSLPVDPSGVFGTNGDNLIGLPMTNQAYQGFSEMAFPNNNESNIGTSAIVNLIRENNFYYADNLTWQHGRHALKFGAQVLRYQQNYYYAGNSGALGSFTYSGQYTTNANVTNGYGYGFADFVMDESSSINIGGVSGLVGQRQYRNAFFVQDDWHVFPNLTINLGVRWGYNQPMYEVNNKEVSVNMSNPSMVTINGLEFAGKNGNSRALYDPFYGGVMPRLGFAWSPSSRLVLRGGYGISDAMEGTGTNRRMTQNYPFQSSLSAGALSPSATGNGSPGFPVENGFSFGPGASGTPLENYSNFNLWDPHIKPTLVQQFNLAWQYLITPSWTAQVGYVGELGQHLMVPNEVNQWSSDAPWLAFINGYNGYNYNGWNYDCTGASFTPSPSCGLTGNYGNLQETTSNAISNYNALQASIVHMPTHGLSYRFNYTWSKALTDNAGFYGAPNVAVNSWFFQDSTNPMGDYGPAGQDTRNAFNGYWSYLLPFGRGQHFGSNMPRALDEVAGGWKVSGSVVMYSGFPITMGSGENYNVNSFGAHSQHFRPIHIANRTIDNWFGTDPSAQPCVHFDNNGNTIDNGTCAYGLESYNSFGNTRPGSERAPGYRQVDLSAMKIFHITEQHSLEFRGDAFNALNIVSYGAPNAYLGSYNSSATNGHGTFGVITSSNSSPRIMQVAMHYRF